MADKTNRIRSIIEKNVRDILQFELKDPKVGMVCPSEFVFARDNSEVKVFVSFLGTKYTHQAFEELKKSEGFVRSSLAKKVDLYKVPKIVFVYDESYERAARLEEALRREEEQLESMGLLDDK